MLPMTGGGSSPGVALTGVDLPLMPLAFTAGII